MNRAGDAVVAWVYGAYNTGGNTVLARSRPAGGTWQPAPAIASGRHEVPDAVAVGARRAAVIALQKAHTRLAWHCM